MAQTVKNLPTLQETQVQSLGQEEPLERKWQSTPVFLSRELHGQRGLAGYNPWARKSWTGLSDCTFTFMVQIQRCDGDKHQQMVNYENRSQSCL